MNGISRVLVTGGAGFIGGHLVDRLLGNGLEVDVLDNLMSGSVKNVEAHSGRDGFRFFKGDVRDRDVLKPLVAEADCVVHLAAVSDISFSMKEPLLTDEVNVAGTLNLLKACLDADVERFVFASSAAVYGEPRYLPVDEEHPASPISPYGVSKLAGEEYLAMFRETYGLKTVALRLFNVYGSRQGLNGEGGVVVRFMNCLHRGGPLTVHGNGAQTRDFVHVSDVVEALGLCLNRARAVGEVFNVGSGVSTTVCELAKTVLNLTGHDSGLVYDEPRVGDIKDSYANIEKAKQLLGYAPKVALQKGLKTLFQRDAENLIV